jgi:arylsulfatase A-like enzyme
MRALLPLLALAAGCARTTSMAEETRASERLANAPNIVLVLLDDLEVEAFRFMPRTQALIADSGATFDSAFVSAPLCCPSRVSLLRGQYAHNTGVLANAGREGGFEAAYRLGVERSTLATWLADAGYRTAFVGKYLNNYPDRANPRYVPPGWRRWAVPVSGTPYAGFNYVLNVDGELRRHGSGENDYTTDVFRDIAVDFMTEASRANVPFFAMLSSYAPHAPSTPAPRHAALFDQVRRPAVPAMREGDLSDQPTFMRDLPVAPSAETSAWFDEQYRLRVQSLQAVDEAVERIVETLRELGELERTLIIVTSDNGFHFEHHGLWMGKETPYEEDLRVPLVMRGLGIAPGRRVAEAALNIDLAPTILDLAGIRGDDTEAPIDGRSLAPLLTGSRPERWRRAFLVTRDLPERLAKKGARLAAEATADGVAVPSDLAIDAAPPPRPSDSARVARRAARDSASPERRTRSPILTPEERRAYARIATYPSFRGVRTSDGWMYVRHGSGDEELYDLSRDPHQLHNLMAEVPLRTPVIATREWLRQWTEALASCQGKTCRSVEDHGPPGATVAVDPE